MLIPHHALCTVSIVLCNPPNSPFPTENYCQDDRRIRAEDSFCLRMEFWRDTAK
jgi:hypothetical protein